VPALIITVFVEGRNPNKGTTTWLLVMTLLQYCEQETHALLCLAADHQHAAAHGATRCSVILGSRNEATVGDERRWLGVISTICINEFSVLRGGMGGRRSLLVTQTE
jgi:hypothetical protein